MWISRLNDSGGGFLCCTGWLGVDGLIAVQVLGDGLHAAVEVVLQRFDTWLDRFLFGEPQQLPMVILRKLAQPHGGKIETQEALFFVQAFFNQTHQALVVSLVWLGQRCRTLWAELVHPQYNGLTVAEVLELEQAEMMPMPTAFDGYVERTVRVSSTCLISVARNRYSVPCERVGQWVSSRLYPSRIVVIADETVIASHERLFDRDQVGFDWQHYIPLIERKPGALRNGAPFADLPKPLQLLKRGLRRHTNGDRIMMQVLAAVPIAGLEPVLVAVELVLESGSLSADHILNVVARLTSTAPPPCVETSLQLKVAPVANTARYDRLRTTDEENRNA